MTATGQIRTSVIIPAYRARATLPAVLQALAPQIGCGREAWLVESGADRDSAEFAHLKWLKVISTPHRLSPGQARNRGAANARGELLAFLDADALPSADWLDRMEEAITPQLDAVVGVLLNGTPHSRIGTAEYLLTCSETFPGRARPLRHAPSSCLLVRRDSFRAVGGFDERLRAGEDTVLTFPIASRGRLGFASGATAEHANRTQLRPFLANQRRQGGAFVVICSLVPYPNRWVARRSVLWLAGPLRLAALGRVLLFNRRQARSALRALLPLLLGTAAWVAGAYEARGAPGYSETPPS